VRRPDNIPITMLNAKGYLSPFQPVSTQKRLLSELLDHRAFNENRTIARMPPNNRSSFAELERIGLVTQHEGDSPKRRYYLTEKGREVAESLE
jgi:hypothetical protein